MNKVASIFGGGSKEITQEYLDTVEIGRILAEKGYTVKTGGYSGIMEAANKGSFQNGGESIGVVCDTFISTKGNEYLTEKIISNDIFHRLRVLMNSNLLFKKVELEHSLNSFYY